jgi:hypothetical protein
LLLYGKEEPLSSFDRRTFVQLSTAALLTAATGRLSAKQESPVVSSDNGRVRVRGSNYSWEYAQKEDLFRLLDSKGRVIVSGKMQPAVVVSPVDNPLLRISTPGKASAPRTGAGKVTIGYSEVNGSSSLEIVWRFDENGIWTDPIRYESNAAQDVVSLHYFADGSTTPLPTLHPTYLVAPGVVSGSMVSPILRDTAHLETSAWLGRGSSTPGLLQQWGLPVHYFCGFSVGSPVAEHSLFTEGKSDAFTCGLADLPSGDLFLQTHEGKVSPWIDYRSDLWKHMRGPGSISLGATFVWSVAPDYYQSIGAYYDALLNASIIHKKENSAHKTAVALTPEFCTWGAQRTQGKAGDLLDESFLNSLYRDFKKSGMKAGLFSIDDKWEGVYGTLEHSPERLPHFEDFLSQLRGEGLRIGLWAALMRCEKPSDLGLTVEHMLRKPDGSPYHLDNGKAGYYILDFTQPEVAKVLTTVIRKFIRRYKPDVFKFDFGYELPSVRDAAPQDKQWSGERLMWKGLEVVIKAMREENPDQVVMYYNLSPLFLEYFDLHSPDDLFLDIGDYEVEANRRLYFSSLMGKLGVPTYGSTGYDWASAPSIWFDSAALGTLGSLNDFVQDEEDEGATPHAVAKYNGILHTLRPSNFFDVQPLGNVSFSPTRGAHARSWARFEKGQLVLYAYRPPVPGEENPLVELSESDSRVKDMIRSAVPVIVSSRGDENIMRSNSLAVVAYGAGEIEIRRQQGRHAAVVSHYFGGASTKSSAVIQDGRLKLTAVAQDAAGAPLEWMELSIS